MLSHVAEDAQISGTAALRQLLEQSVLWCGLGFLPTKLGVGHLALLNDLLLLVEDAIVALLQNLLSGSLPLEAAHRSSRLDR